MTRKLSAAERRVVRAAMVLWHGDEDMLMVTARLAVKKGKEIRATGVHQSPTFKKLLEACAALATQRKRKG